MLRSVEASVTVLWVPAETLNHQSRGNDPLIRVRRANNEGQGADTCCLPELPPLAACLAPVMACAGPPLKPLPPNALRCSDPLWTRPGPHHPFPDGQSLFSRFWVLIPSPGPRRGLGQQRLPNSPSSSLRSWQSPLYVSMILTTVDTSCEWLWYVLWWVAYFT